MTRIFAPLFATLSLVGSPLPVAAQEPRASAPEAGAAGTPVGLTKDPYGFPDWRLDFPLPLDLPQRSGRPYDRSRRQALERLAANLQGNVRREAWQFATEFFWHGPDDAIEPLIEVMDRALPSPALQDVVKNAVEAMGKMGREQFDEAIRRALEHPNQAVRQAAFAALSRSGSTATVREAFRHFRQMDGRARAAWLHAARVRLGSDAVPMFRELMLADDLPVLVRDGVLQEALRLPLPDAATILRDRWADAVGEFKVVIAGVLHATGDLRGTTLLRELLLGEDLKGLELGARNAVRGDPGELREPLLRLATHPRAEVRLEVARALSRIPGEDVDRTFEVLTNPDEVLEVRKLALRELNRRGKTGMLTTVLEDLPSATGTRLQVLLDLIVASGDVRAVPLFAERFRRAPAGEGRSFLQALAFSGADGALVELGCIFLEPERAVTPEDRRGERHTTIDYIPTLMLNLRGQEDALLALWSQVPRGDWKRRAHLLPTVLGVGLDREDPGLRSRCEELVRAVLFDAAELAQLRILALNLLAKRSLTIDDAMRLKAMARSEQPSMRALLSDFLNEFF